MSPTDNFNDSVLEFLGLRDRAILKKLAEVELRSEVDELLWLIRARASGRLKDLGDDRFMPQVDEADLPEVIRPRAVRLERSGAGDVVPPTPPRSTPR